MIIHQLITVFRDSMNKPISFELSKMLKEKGFDSLTCKQGYHGDFGELKGDEYPFLGTYTFIQDCLIRNNCDWKIQTPTIAEVVMWLYEKHGIWISVLQHTKNGKGIYFESVVNLMTFSGYDSPTEAYEAAIIYTLKNLI